MSEERDYEAEASKEGWAPKENWKGPDEKWKTAEQFVKDGENITPILRSKVERLEGRVEQLLSSNKESNEYMQKSRDKDRKENERLIGELEVLRTQAVTDSDGEAFQRADSQIQELRSEPEVRQPDPVVDAWVGGNQWYGTNRKLTAFADGIADQLRATGYTGQAYFDELTKQVKETFPDDFGNPNRNRPSGVEDGGQEEGDSKSKTFNDLPNDAKVQYAAFKRDIPGFTKEQYVENYDFTEE